ncbi:MAG: glycosyltransferase family 39 protein, partial [Chloroflexota bacterium]
MIRQHRLLVLVLITYVFINLLYNTASPIFEPPDEATHYRYIKYLLDHRTLPALIDGPNREELWGLHQPPLYFLISAVLSSPFDHITPTDFLDKNPHVNLGFATRPGNKNFFMHAGGESFPYDHFPRLIHGLRLVSLVYGAITLGFVYATGLMIFSGRQTTAAIAPAFMTLHPEFVFINAEIANEPLNILLMAAGVWGCVRLILMGPTRQLALFMGCVAGLIAIAKMTGLALFLLIAMAMLIAALRKHAATKLWEFGVIVGALAAFLGGWWYARNY